MKLLCKLGIHNLVTLKDNLYTTRKACIRKDCGFAVTVRVKV